MRGAITRKLIMKELANIYKPPPPRWIGCKSHIYEGINCGVQGKCSNKNNYLGTIKDEEIEPTIIFTLFCF